MAIVGLGLIGGSVGLALRKRTPIEGVVGFDVDPQAVAGALECGAVDAGADSLEDAAVGVDLVIVATPVDLIPGVLDRIACVRKPQCDRHGCGERQGRGRCSRGTHPGNRFRRRSPDVWLGASRDRRCERGSLR